MTGLRATRVHFITDSEEAVQVANQQKVHAKYDTPHRLTCVATQLTDPMTVSLVHTSVAIPHHVPWQESPSLVLVDLIPL